MNLLKLTAIFNNNLISRAGLTLCLRMWFRVATLLVSAMKTLFGVRRALLRVTASLGGVWLVLGTQLVGIAIYANQTIIYGDPEKATNPFLFLPLRLVALICDLLHSRTPTRDSSDMTAVEGCAKQASTSCDCHSSG
ncbi:uncharacterized protein LOC143024094 isoform X3 [Oratosquilla oratoria]|uniref:uncharacterized protein LOC143024094 isoform X3 n=1 Tax=Oratosquilla oratoria TaxID=337810 RepID=UPI003F75C0D2